MLIENPQDFYLDEQLQQLLQNFSCVNRLSVLKKIEGFARAGANRIHLLFDFDRTLTVQSTCDEDITTWQILKAHLHDKELLQYYDSVHKYYRHLERDGNLTLENAVFWWEESLRIFRDGGVNFFDVEKDFLSKVTIRKQAKEVFQQAEALHIPSIILSAGIEDIIRLWSQQFDVYPSVILATKLHISNEGLITGWEEKSLIHALNKKEQGHAEVSKMRRTHPFTILVGDGIDDALVVDGGTNVLRIRIYDPRDDEKADKKEEVRRLTFERFDLMIENGSFQPILQLLTYLQNNSGYK